MKKLLEELVMIHGIAGYEDEVRNFIRARAEKYMPLHEDNIGNLIATKGDGRHVVFVAHMDELGLVITNIEENGTLKFKKIGGTDDRALIGRPLEIATKKGIVHGVIGIKPPHLTTDREEMKKTVQWEDMCIDVGTRSREETEGLGISVLNPARIKRHFVTLNQKIIATRGIDNRFGCAVLLKALENIKDLDLKITLSFVWSVQEEMGLRGARVVANTMSPDYMFAIDTYTTSDAPGAPTYYTPARLGKGPVLRVIDNRAIASMKLNDWLLSLAEKKGIPLQIGVTGGSTDAVAVQEAGSLVMPIGIPIRYTHSPVECGHLDDMENLVKLVTAIIEDMNK